MSTVPLRDRYIVAARLFGYLAKPHAAIELLSEALEQFPDDARLLRFRGHRRISVRDYGGAIADLSSAAGRLADVEDEYEMYQSEVEKDVVHLLLDRDSEVRNQHLTDSQAAEHPEVLGRYLTTLHTSVWYHLGVAQYLRGQFDAAIDSFAKAESSSRHQEGTVASQDWQYMAMRRLGRDADAAAVLDRFRAMELVPEEHSVGYESRMYLYSGQITASELWDMIDGSTLQTATQGYGLGNWHLYNSEPDRAREVFDAVLATGVKHSFAYLAVQEEYSRNPDLTTTTRGA